MESYNPSKLMQLGNLMLKKLLLFSLTFSSLAFASSEQIQAGKKIVLEGKSENIIACMTCHMENGEGMQDSAFPQLAGMHPAYLSKQLKDLRGAKLRLSDVMNPIAKDLSDEDIANVSAYYASMPRVSKIEKSTSTTKYEQGRLIAERGLWNKGVPACFSCHGPNAEGVGENFPPLINQGKLYVSQELQRWKDGSRKNDPLNLMKTIAKRLTQKEIEAVAEYLSTMPTINVTETK